MASPLTLNLAGDIALEFRQIQLVCGQIYFGMRQIHFGLWTFGQTHFGLWTNTFWYVISYQCL